MSFITEFNVGGLPTLNLASACEKTYFDGTNLLKCPQVANGKFAPECVMMMMI